MAYVTPITIQAEWNDEFPIIPMQCFECNSYFDKHKTLLFRRVLGYSFNAHIINLECVGGCGTWMQQAWHRTEETNTYKLHSICLKKIGKVVEK